MQAKQPLLLVGSVVFVMPLPGAPRLCRHPPCWHYWFNERNRSTADRHTSFTPRITQIYVDVEHILAGNASDLTRVLCRPCRKATTVLSTPVRFCSKASDRHPLPALADESRALGEKICRFLGELTRQVLLSQCPMRFISLVVMSQWQQPVVRRDRISYYGEGGAMRSIRSFLGGVWSRSVMTKAGGFGDGPRCIRF